MNELILNMSRKVAGTILAFLLIPMAVTAQPSGKSTVTGHIFDSNGVPLPAVTVQEISARSERGGAKTG